MFRRVAVQDRIIVNHYKPLTVQRLFCAVKDGVSIALLKMVHSHVQR